MRFNIGTAIIWSSDRRPEDCLKTCCIRIPMRKEARSLNLSNSAAIVLYEALRQQRFTGLQAAGELTGREEAGGSWLDYI